MAWKSRPWRHLRQAQVGGHHSPAAGLPHAGSPVCRAGGRCVVGVPMVLVSDPSMARGTPEANAVFWWRPSRGAPTGSVVVFMLQWRGHRQGTPRAGDILDEPLDVEVFAN